MAEADNAHTPSGTLEDLEDVSPRNPDASPFLASNQESNIIAFIDQGTSMEQNHRAGQQSLNVEPAMIAPIVQEFGSQTTPCERPEAVEIEAFSNDEGINSGGVVPSSGGQHLENVPATSAEEGNGEQVVHAQESDHAMGNTPPRAAPVCNYNAESAVHCFRGSALSRLDRQPSLSCMRNLLLPTFSGPVHGITELSIPSESGYPHFVCLVEEDNMPGAADRCYHLYALPASCGE